VEEANLEREISPAGGTGKGLVEARRALDEVTAWLAELPPAERAAPACYVEAGKTLRSKFRQTSGRGCVPLVRPNYEYFNKALPRSAPQVLIITPITRCFDTADKQNTEATSPSPAGCVWARRGRPRRPIAGVTSTRERQASGDCSNASYSQHTGQMIADLFNARGLRPGKTDRFSGGIINHIQKDYGLKSRDDRLRAVGMLTKPEIADLLGITGQTVHRWWEHGLLCRSQYNDKGDSLFERPALKGPVKKNIKLADRARMLEFQHQPAKEVQCEA